MPCFLVQASGFISPCPDVNVISDAEFYLILQIHSGFKLLVLTSPGRLWFFLVNSESVRRDRGGRDGSILGKLHYMEHI